MSLWKKLFGIILSGGDKLELPTADGSADQILKTDGSGNLDWATNSGGGAAFGSEYHSNAVEGSSTTSSTTFVQKVRLTTGSVAAGDYYIGWQYQWNMDSVQRDFKGQVDLDEGTLLMSHQQEAADAGADQLHYASGFAVVTLTAATHTVDIDFSVTNGGDVATIAQARLILYRVS